MDIPSRVIYVGSIPYDQTEEQILDIFKTVGPVANIRLVFDKESGKSKGFAFVEYVDPGSAASAVRNLNNYQIGSRNLKVDFSRETSVNSPGLNPLSSLMPGPGMGNSSSANPSPLNMQAGQNNSYAEIISSLPQGTMPPPGVAAYNAINKTLTTLTRDQRLDIIMDLRNLSQKNPALAFELFNSAPQLSYMAIQSMMMLGLIDDNMVLYLASQQTQQQQQQQQPQPQQQQQQAQYEYQQEQNTKPSVNMNTNDRQFRNTPPPSAPSSSASQPQPQVQPQTEQPNQEIELIRKVMELTDEQVAQLSKEQREALMVLREKVRNGEYQL